MLSIKNLCLILKQSYQIIRNEGKISLRKELDYDELLINKGKKE